MRHATMSPADEKNLSTPTEPIALITGTGGLIGRYLLESAPHWGAAWQTVGWSHEQINLTDGEAVRRQFKELRPSLVIHCAALSRPGPCRDNPDLARAVNVEATARLAELAANIPLIFFSTDLVFDGRQGRYDETAPVNPLSFYAETKVAGEQLVLANPRHTVIRTSLNMGRSLGGNRSFIEELRNTWRAGRAITLFTDEYRCPIPCRATAQAIWELARADRPGLYHVAGAERLSRWEIGQLAAAQWPHLHPQYQSALAKDVPGPPRPLDTSLNCAKIQSLLSFPLPSFRDWVATEMKKELG